MSLDHLFFKYGEEEITRWVTTLKLIRLCTLYPYLNDMSPERFLACIKNSDEENLTAILTTLNLQDNQQKPIKSQYKEYNENHSSSWIPISGCSCQLNVNKIRRTIEIEISGVIENPYKLDNTVFLRAMNLESFLSSKKLCLYETHLNMVNIVFHENTILNFVKI